MLTPAAIEGRRQLRVFLLGCANDMNSRDDHEAAATLIAAYDALKFDEPPGARIYDFAAERAARRPASTPPKNGGGQPHDRA